MVDAHILAQEYISKGHQKIKENAISEAKEYYQKSLDLEPTSYEAYFYLGNCAFQHNSIQEAQSYYQRAATLNPMSVEVLCNLGICANILHDTDTGIAYFTKAIAIEPSHILARTQKALLLEEKGMINEAITELKEIEQLDPTNVAIITHIAQLYGTSSCYDQAISYYRKSCCMKPDSPDLMIGLANTLINAHQEQEAIALYYKVLEKNPTLTTTLHNFGFLLKKLGYVDQAIEVYKRVIEQRPDYALAHLNLGIAYLSKGDFARGFLEYEWRFEAYNVKRKEFPQPRWDGSNLKDKRIYVYGEQGFGDIFQCMRYIPLLKKQGAYVIFHVPTALKAIVSLCPYIDMIVSNNDPLPDFDYHSSLWSLPLLFNTTLDTIPIDIPYIYADQTLVQKWADRLSDTQKFKIGICWHGNQHYQDLALKHNVIEKSCTLADFTSIASIPGVTLYNLQRIETPEEKAELAHYSFLQEFDDSFDETHGRFMDSAAVIKSLNLVITVDTSTAHFAAALGTPTWIILPKHADWRWMHDRSDSPWYPNVRLFRQKQQGNWTEVMHTIKQELVEVIAQKTQTKKYNNTHCIGQKLRNYIQQLHTQNSTYSDLAIAYALQYDLTLL
jgi:tetratricopeptide (TPR) repeat protein